MGSPIRIMPVVGARPNFMKIAPLMRALAAHGDAVETCLVHTGQHYDDAMSAAFFRDLEIPRPDIDLEVGSGSHAEQVGRTMIAFEQVVREWRPDWVVVVGDVNATCACSITAKKEHIKLAHVEAGIRSFDMRMPEEVNRLVTDRLADLLLTPDRFADANLASEGVPGDRAHMVGNIMIDTLDRHLPRALERGTEDVLAGAVLEGQSVAEGVLASERFATVTLHRPSNVDTKASLAPLADYIRDVLSAEMPVFWTVHPRTRKQLESFGLWDALLASPRTVLLSPLDYHGMLRLTAATALMLTDSGGLQEECCVLGTPCLTLRENTERPATLAEHGGGSALVGNDVAKIRNAVAAAIARGRQPHRPERWDGRTAERIAAILVEGGDASS